MHRPAVSQLPKKAIRTVWVAGRRRARQHTMEPLAKTSRNIRLDCLAELSRDPGAHRAPPRLAREASKNWDCQLLCDSGCQFEQTATEERATTAAAAGDATIALFFTVATFFLLGRTVLTRAPAKCCTLAKPNRLLRTLVQIDNRSLLGPSERETGHPPSSKQTVPGMGTKRRPCLLLQTKSRSPDNSSRPGGRSLEEVRLEPDWNPRRAQSPIAPH